MKCEHSISELFQKLPFKIDSRLKQPYIIAEAGVNHEGSFDTALRLIDEAKEGGADAIKFQTYKAGKIAVRDSPAYWDTSKESTKTQYRLFTKYDKFGVDEFQKLSEYCVSIGIEFMSTPFDADSAAYLNEFMKCFKISSSDITNKPFIQQIAGYGKPIIISTGASDIWEVQEAKAWVEEINLDLPVCIMHCVLNYPTDDNDAYLDRILRLRHYFGDTIIGYSDHTLPKKMKTIELAYLLGAHIIEKHFTYDKTLLGNDHYHAMDKEDLKNFRTNVAELSPLIGDSKNWFNVQEIEARNNARRSLVINKPISKGSQLTDEHLTWKRPATGISPKYIDKVIGAKVVTDISVDSILKWSHLEDK